MLPICALLMFAGIIAGLVMLGGETPRIVAEGSGPARTQDAAMDLGARLAAAELVDATLPRDRWDPAYIVKGVGKNSKKLLAWVKANSTWIPYRGILRGPVGVLMDGRGNSLDRSLLLADLLQRAGHTVRLAHGELLQTDAAARLPALVANEVAARDAMGASAATGISNGAWNAAVAALAGKKADAARVLSALEARVAGQTQRLLTLVGRGDADKEWGNRFATALAALQDHWWVQRETNAGWVDMDLLTDNGKSPVVARSTFLPEALSAAEFQHEITLRVIAEQWTDGGLAEHVALEQTLRPVNLIGRSIVLQFWPTAPIKAQTPEGRDELKTSEGGDWAAMLMIDRDLVNAGILRESGEDSEHPGLRGAIDGSAAASMPAGLTSTASAASGANRSTLSAVWLEYEIKAPGEKPFAIRRAVFDLVGPHRRAEGAPQRLTLDGAARRARARAMMMRSEILPISSGIAPEFVAHLVAQSLIGNRQLLSEAMKPGTTQAAIADLARQAAPTVTSLYALALDASGFGATVDNGRPIYVDKLLLLTNHAYPKPGQDSVIVEATDIVANDIGISLVAKDAFAMRLREGVRHTNAESLFRGREAIANTADAFAILPLNPRTEAWVALTAKDEARIDALAMPADARRQILDEVANGQIVIAPKAALMTANGSFAGWWRIDRATGVTLGVDANGWGQSMGEYAVTAGPTSASGIAVSQAFGPFLAGFAGGYVWCVAPKTDDSLERGAIGLKPALTDSAAACTTDNAVRGAFATLPLVALTLDRSARAPRVPPPPPKASARGPSLAAQHPSSLAPAPAPARPAIDLATAEARMRDAVRAQKDAQVVARRASEARFKATQAFIKNRVAKPNPSHDWDGDPANWNEAADPLLEAEALRAQSEAAKARKAEAAADAAFFAAKADCDAAVRDSKTN